MGTDTLTLTDFLLARLEEDKEVAFGGAPSPWTVGRWDGQQDGPREILDRFGTVHARTYYGGTTAHVERFDPTRVLKDIQAKRGIVERLGYCEHRDQSWIHHCDDCITLTLLALPYADHPDYRDEWKP